jgi:hypothetical protein
MRYQSHKKCKAMESEITFKRKTPSFNAAYEAVNCPGNNEDG